MAELSNIITGELNLDQSPKFLPKGDYSDARNIITGTSVSSDKIRLEKLIGTVAISESLGYTVSKVIGKCVDESNGDVYFMATTTVPTANKIIKKNSSNVLSTIVSYDFGWNDSLILNSVFFIQNSIVWIDNSDEIKRFPLDTYPVTPSAGALAASEISLMKKPPLVQPQIFCDRVTDVREQDVVTRDADYQFAVYFEYIDGGVSVLSPISKGLARQMWDPYLGALGTESQNFKIYFDIDPTDVVGAAVVPDRRDTAYNDIPKSVRNIVFCGKRIRSSTWYQIGKISRTNDATYDLGLGKFSTNYIKFDSTLSGIAVPSNQSSVQFFVPKDPSTIVVANNKVFAFNFTEGYEAPVTTGVLSARADLRRDITGTGPCIGDIIKMDYYSIIWDATNGEYVKTKQLEATYTKYVMFNAETGYYDTDFNPLTYVPGTTVTIGALVDLSGTGTQNKTPVAYFRYEKDPDGGAKSAELNITAHTWLSGDEVGVVNNGYAGSLTFSGDSAYKGAYVFSDNFGRKSDVVSPEGFVVSFGKQKIRTGGIDYELNIEALDIPSWATNLEVLISKNTEKTLYLSGRSAHTAYKKINVDGDEYYDGNWTADNLGLGVSIEGMVRQGFGYEFQEGDRLKLYDLKEGVGSVVRVEVLDEPIIGTDGYYVLVSGEDFTGDSVVDSFDDYDIEIYRPSVGDRDSIFYGNGQTHILTPGVRNTVRGILSGDLFVNIRKKFDPYNVGPLTGLIRSTDLLSFVYESSMTLDDDQIWALPVGKPFLETNFGEVIKENYVRWGGNIINDTKINGLGDFLALDEATTPVEHGPITAATLVGDTQSAGTVILALTATKPISLYIGATTLTNADGTNSTIKSADEVGLVRPHEDDYGTLNPESVYSRNGEIFFFDAVNRCYCRYSSNGISEISKDKVSSFFRDIPLSTSTVITGYYNEYDMILITVKDGFGAITETIGYDIKEKKWKGFFDIFPDTYIDAHDVMYTVKDGVFYKSLKIPGGANLRSNFHGTQYDSTIDIVFNDDVVSEKTWEIIPFDIDPGSIEWSSGDQRLVDTSATITVSNEAGQESVIGIADMVVEDGTVFASILLDANSTGGYLSGDEIRSRELIVKFTFTTSDNIQLGVVRAVYTPS